MLDFFQGIAAINGFLRGRFCNEIGFEGSEGKAGVGIEAASGFPCPVGIDRPLGTVREVLATRRRLGPRLRDPRYSFFKQRSSRLAAPIAP